MTRKFILFLALCFNTAFSQNPLPLIPQPQSLQILDGNFVLNKQTVIEADPNLFEAKCLQQEIKKLTGLELRIGINLKSTTKIGFYDLLSGGFDHDDEAAVKYYSNP